jgi:ABC-2 type transport system ATP-binding protein
MVSTTEDLGPATGAADRTAQPAIAIRDLRVIRGGTMILDGITLDVPPGCVYGLVGPSGSGKTTLIRAIIGRQRIAAGEVSIGGRPAASPELRAAIGYMPQSEAIYDDLTARENLQFFGQIYRVPPARVVDVLGLVDLAVAADRPVTTLSGGQRRRVSLAAALLPSPPFLILDEPTVGLDPRLRVTLWERFRSLAASGTTLLVSTHVIDEAAKTDRLAFLAEGRLVAEGTPAELLARSGAADLEDAVLRLTAPTGGER